MGMIEKIKGFFGVGSSTGGGSNTIHMTFGRQRMMAVQGARGIAGAYNTVPSFYAMAQQAAGDLASTKWYAQTRQGTEREDSPIIQDILGPQAKPNPGMSGYEFRKLASLYYLLVGEFFAIRLDDGLYPIPPHQITILSDGDDVMFDVHLQGSIFRLNQRVAQDRVIWMKQNSLIDPYGRGMGLGHALASELELDTYASEYVNAYFNNNASPSRIIHATGAGGDAMKKMKEYLQAEYGGSKNAGKTLLTGDDEAALQVVRIDDSPADAELLKVREQVRDIVRQTWGIPPSIMGDMSNSGGFENVRTEDYVYAKRFLVPKLRDMQAQWQRISMDYYGSPDLIGHEDVVPENMEFKAELIEKAPHAFTINEIRALASMPERPDGDVYWRGDQAVPAEEIPETDDSIVVDFKSWDIENAG